MNRFFKIGFVVIFLFGLCGVSLAADEVRVGIVAPITGQAAIAGQYIKNGVELAVKEYAPNGTIKLGGAEVALKVIFEDNENKPEITANAFRKLIDQDEVCAIVGPDASTVALAGAPIAQSAEIPTIATFATNPRVTQVGDYIFRACFIDPFQGKVMAKYAYENMKTRKAAILYNNGNDFSKGLTEFFTREYEALGGKIVITEAYGGADIRDFNAQLNNIKGTDAEVLYMPNEYYVTGLQMTQARRAGIKLPLIGGDGWDTPEIVQVAAGAEEGASYTCAFSHEATTPEAQAFVKAYNEAYKQNPNSNAVLAYEATAIVLKAIETAGTTDGPKLRDTIAAIKMSLPSGVIQFDAERNPQKAAVILQFQNGTPKYITTIQP
ncbi:MAG: ABC transporter substrate-binding protein [Synergistaceae bacterium]|nr:ABC transporter substrate-binding protein [Synergistaceae bacterium]